jgi:hypothetical protein
MKRGQCVFRVISTTTDPEPGNGPGRTDRPEVSQCEMEGGYVLAAALRQPQGQLVKPVSAT